MTLVSLLLLAFTAAVSHSIASERQYTNRWVVQLEHGLTKRHVDDIAAQVGCLNYGKVFDNEAESLYVFHHPRVQKRSTDRAQDVHEALQQHVMIRSAEQEEVKVRVKRGKRAHIPEPGLQLSDPYWAETWYLKRGINDANQFDMNVIPAWKKGYSGKNIVVTILDDGIEHDHPDLQANYDPQASRDINDNDADPMPRYDYTNENRHGTRCAGEVAAVANNTVCSVGVAYDAKIGGVRMLDGEVTDSVEALSLSHNPQHVDIYSASWGPDDNGRTVDGPGKLAKKAFEDGILKGRGGKGSIYVWASGNGGNRGDSCACDGYTNSIYTLSVSSASEHNTSPWYLEECASTLATTYSSGANSGEQQIVSTDLRKQCTTRHTGTSASAPLAAGLIAVMLEANPTLNWRDVQYITLMAANPEPLQTSGNFFVNGVGKKVSHKFGYGLMDADKMVTLAKEWRSVPPQLRIASSTVSPASSLSSGTLSASIDVPSCSQDNGKCIRHLEHVQLLLSMSSSHRGQLMVVLVSPSGTRSTILPKRGEDSVASDYSEWPFMSVHFWGEDPSGKWTFEITNGMHNTGLLTSYQLVLYGVFVDPTNPKRPAAFGEKSCDPSCDVSVGCTGPFPNECIKCARGLFKVGDTRECVSACPLVGYHADNGTAMCLKCHTSCATCYGTDDDDCKSCAPPKVLDPNSVCVSSCPDPFFADHNAGVCQLCSVNCSQCTSVANCTACNQGFELVNGLCLQPCALRQYRDELGTCVPCGDVHCVRCTSDDLCIDCDPHYLLYKGDCTITCPYNTYNRTHREQLTECFDCDKKCATCHDREDNNCDSCVDGYELSPFRSCIPKRVCSVKEFKNMEGGCDPCHVSCASCTGNDRRDCTSCPEPSYLKDGTCVEQCGNSFFHYTSVDNHTSCQSCDTTCLTCSGPSSFECLTCVSGQTLNSGQCVSTCSPGFFMEATNICKSCPPNCQRCSASTNSSCIVCKPDFYLQDRSCVSECGSGYYPPRHDNAGSTVTGLACQLCHHSCRTCTGAEPSSCTSCAEGVILVTDRCVNPPTCHSNQFFKNSSNECESCHHACATCRGPAELDCITCPGTQALHPQLRLCKECCAQGCSEGDLKCHATTEKEEESQQDGNKRIFVVIVILSILGLILLYFIIFAAMQSRTRGSCCTFAVGSKVLVDGGGVIAYSSLTTLDPDVASGLEDGLNKGVLANTIHKSQLYSNGTGHAVLDYESD